MLSVLLGNGNGTFAPSTDYAGGNGVWDVTIANLNADAIPDLAVVNRDTGSEISVLIGTGKKGPWRFGDGEERWEYWR